ncbi:SIR2 family NAD-dependent protein deacylase [Pseudopedobacter beijingensis]|uniref:protein acetyllysine N-acetyltransferase n=1 Tax=Pseudopedobacter beijingensis TaxID=1207056 RepID=A0ABW4IGL4_9SPHI
MKKIIVLTGAGISAESGLKTFRGNDGLWEGYDIYEVATPEAWHKNSELVQQFYNDRRKSVIEALPNAAHLALKQLEEKFNVLIITQNIDDLHERAGSTDVMHLHGEIRYAQSSKNPALLYPIDGYEIKMGEKCRLGSQLRPHVVWFGEAVPMMTKAIHEMPTADIVILVGSSLAVYPANTLFDYLNPLAEVYIVDPERPDVRINNKVTFLQGTAAENVPQLVGKLLR